MYVRAYVCTPIERVTKAVIFTKKAAKQVR